MAPCRTCGKPGMFGAAHPVTGEMIWACGAHRAALPKGSPNYADTEPDDIEAAMLSMAAHLSRQGKRKEAAAIGRDAMRDAFKIGLMAFFAARTERLKP